ncbi:MULTISPECIES: hypothetical protein [Pedobacter]|uniref:Uncharacterized protein n=1 Tax=Pedobacter heparinus (strain ATCC 13125 / DSM 2366 / CIP 104194 / JCM 7457 / NBRC 12017 / NCIMB 9290 / NRRL B-14731 / HIM 762-3) TaxID=485917 RepID=C6XT32_PEDHD|nr:MULTISPECIES: hypothetical protein [Pedobacter]ACU03593.1 hypothetical protein Phep_1379 [Pedobacter heparinus DSM 2366]MBB5436895.1 hypothetical protein [Pedobacter sp. AK017]
MKRAETQTEEQELPPFVKTWKQFYRLLIAWLVFLILIFYAFTKYFE